MKIIETQTHRYNTEEDALPDDIVTAHLWDDGSVNLMDLENKGLFIDLEDLEYMVTTMRRTLDIHREDVRFRKSMEDGSSDS